MDAREYAEASQPDPSRKGVDRRSFLKSAVATGALIAVSASLPGCASTGGKATSETAQTTAADVPGSAPEIPESSISKTISCDVVVVGSGISGMAAVRAAAESGAKVVCIEKKKTYEVHGYQLGSLGNKLAKAAGVQEDPMEFLRTYEQISAGRVNMDLIRLWTDYSGSAADWYLEPVADNEHVQKTIKLNYWPPSPVHNPSGDLMQHFVGMIGFDESLAEIADFIATAWQETYKANYDLAVSLGADYHFRTVAMKLTTDSTGKVTGVIAKDSDDKYIKVTASKGVILCTGSLGGEALMKKYCANSMLINERLGVKISFEPGFTKDSTPISGGATGDGHLMGMWAGAQMQPNPDVPFAFVSIMPILLATATLAIDQSGNRFTNEEIEIWTMQNTVVALPGAVAWSIFDVNWRDCIPYQTVGHEAIDYNDTTFINNLDAEILASVGAGKTGVTSKSNGYNSVVYGANTLDELANIINVPADQLKTTIERYNSICDAKRDTDYGKDPQKLFPVAKAPFFASKIKGLPIGIPSTLGGLMTDGKLQCTDASGKTIPGLWVAGNVCGMRFAPHYQTPMSALTHGMAVTHGMLAGQYAAKA